MLLSFYLGNPRVCSFVEAKAPLDHADQEGLPVLQILLDDGGLLEHVFCHALALRLLRAHGGQWRMAQWQYIDMTPLEFRADRKLREACVICYLYHHGIHFIIKAN